MFVEVRRCVGSCVRGCIQSCIWCWRIYQFIRVIKLYKSVRRLLCLLCLSISSILNAFYFLNVTGLYLECSWFSPTILSRRVGLCNCLIRNVGSATRMK